MRHFSRLCLIVVFILPAFGCATGPTKAQRENELEKAKARVAYQKQPEIQQPQQLEQLEQQKKLKKLEYIITELMNRREIDQLTNLLDKITPTKDPLQTLMSPTSGNIKLLYNDPDYFQEVDEVFLALLDQAATDPSQCEMAAMKAEFVGIELLAIHRVLARGVGDTTDGFYCDACFCHFPNKIWEGPLTPGPAVAAFCRYNESEEHRTKPYFPYRTPSPGYFYMNLPKTKWDKLRDRALKEINDVRNTKLREISELEDKNYPTLVKQACTAGHATNKP